MDYGQAAIDILTTKLPYATGNLFNPNDVIIGSYYAGPTLTQNTAYNTPKPIKLKSGTTYITNLTTFLNVSFFDTQQVYVSGISANGWNGSFTIPNNASYVAFAIPVSFDMNTLMLYEGALPSSFQPFGYIIPDAFRSLFLQASDIYIGGIGKNLFDKTKVKTGYEVYTTGAFAVESNSSITNYMPVIGLTNIYVSGLTAYATGFARYCYFYDKDKRPLGSAQTISNTLTEAAIIVPANAVYFAMSVYQRKTSAETIVLDALQIESGTAKTAYEAYNEGVRRIKGFDISKSTASLPAKTAGLNFLLLGDSITETATITDDGVTYTEGTRSNWATFSKTALGWGQMWNYAKSGATYKDRAGQLVRQQISDQINMAITANRPADVIVIAMGTNDGGASLLGAYATAMGKTTLASLDRTNSLYEAIRWAFWTLRNQYPNAVCYASIPLQRADAEPDQNLRTAIIQMANRYSFIVIDAMYESGIVKDFEVASNPGRYLSDGLHPNPSGQQLMSKYFNRVILNTYPS